MSDADRSRLPGGRKRTVRAKATPDLAGEGGDLFVTEALKELNRSDIPYIVAGTYAVSVYTGIRRPTKDLDIFCRAGDFPRILEHFSAGGYEISVKDERWLGKVFRGNNFFDVIFASLNGTMPVSDSWLKNARKVEIAGVPTWVVGPTELVLSKCYIQLRHRYDGADVVHVMLKASDQIDWRRLLEYMEIHWELLLIHILNFRWIYPSERERVPAWLLDELLERLALQRQLPVSEMKICRGRLLSRVDYEIDVREWEFGDVGSEGTTSQDKEVGNGERR